MDILRTGSACEVPLARDRGRRQVEEAKVLAETAALGAKDRAVEALQEVAATEPHHFGRILTLPEIATLGDDARLTALRAQFGLPVH